LDRDQRHTKPHRSGQIQMMQQPAPLETLGGAISQPTHRQQHIVGGSTTFNSRVLSSVLLGRYSPRPVIDPGGAPYACERGILKGDADPILNTDPLSVGVDTFTVSHLEPREAASPSGADGVSENHTY